MIATPCLGAALADPNGVLPAKYLPPFGTLQLAIQRGTAAFGAASNQGNTLFLKATTAF